MKDMKNANKIERKNEGNKERKMKVERSNARKKKD